MTEDATRTEPGDRSPVARARVAGLVGVATLAAGTFAGVVHRDLVVAGDAAATASNLVASETLFRLGLAGGLVMMVVFVVYVLLLYRLLERVDRTWAMAMAALALASVPLYMLNQVNAVGALLSASGGAVERVELFLELHRAGNLVASIFFGLWLFPLGLLVYRSGFLPRALGVLLMAGSPGYVVAFARGFLAPGTEGGLWSDPLLAVTHLSEAALMLWLLVRGLNADAWRERAAGRAAGLGVKAAEAGAGAKAADAGAGSSPGEGAGP